MLVAHVIGALANERERRPAELLEYLNRALFGRTSGGFVTCCCALFDRDGRVEIANAGHIPPFVNGREVEIDTGLPLGLVAEASYGHTSVEIGAGALTLLSDGVAEARNKSGELLGFARAAELTSKPAKEVADAAQAFGQDDDITVVTIKRLASGDAGRTT
jgi:serine phosphatase RsbU (regulator of sigma subunit)